MDDLGIFASILGHIGDGNFHESIMYNRHDPVEKERVEHCVHAMVDRALQMEGSCTVSSRILSVTRNRYKYYSDSNTRENTVLA